MEDPNDQENRLKLPTRKFGLPKFKPPSPKDNTPIIMNGNPIDRSDLTPIVEDKLTRDISPKINLLETPEAVQDLFLNSNNYTNDGEEEQLDEKDDVEDQVEEEPEEQQEENEEVEEQEQNRIQEESEDETDVFNKNNQSMIIQEKPMLSYKKFNPPFPDSNNNKNQVSNRFAYVESVESLQSPNDYSNQSYIKSPKITSPTDVNLSPESRIGIQKSLTSNKNLIQTQLQPIKKQSSEPPSPKNTRDEIQTTNKQFSTFLQHSNVVDRSKENIKQERITSPQPPRIQQTEGRTEARSEGRTEGQPNSYETKSSSFEELSGKAHDCFLKYQILQKSWPEYKFPNLDEKLVYSNPQFIIDTYNKSVERIQIDMDVNQYKIALIIMFLVIEVVCVKFLGLDAGGYTLSQIKAMNRYEKLLIEIGEKRLLTGESSWPPEVRILFIGLLNCGLFILMKYLSSVLGPDLVGYISPIVNGLFSGVLDNSKTASLPDEIPQRQQDITGMLGSVASMAASALGGSPQQNNRPQQQQQRASRRPIFRE
jgi:hypothetical protein